MDGGGHRGSAASGAHVTGGGRGFWQSLRTSPFTGEVWVLLVAAAVVQALFWVRHDWPAHLVAGGALALGVSASVPRRMAPWAGPVGFIAVLAVAVLTEVTVFDPFDPADVTITVLGSLLAAAAGVDVALAAPHERRGVLRWSGVLIVAALCYRFGFATRQA